jgi:putative transposase
LITCEALATTREQYAFAVFDRAFRGFGLPLAMRTDKSVPFASAHALYGLSKLAVWWLRLEIGLERIRPGHPEQNGRHERTHLTLKQQATKSAAANLVQQQARFDAFLQQYNEDQPHQAPRHARPRRRVRPVRPYCGLGELDYPLHDWAVTVTHCGRICYKRRKVNLSKVSAGPQAGVRQVDEHVWLVTFMHYDLGYFDDETCRLEPIENRLVQGLPMSPE